MIRRVISALILLAIAGGLLILAWPQLFALDHAPVIAQVVSLRGACIVVGLVAVVVMVLVLALSRALRRFAASVAVLLLAFCALNAIVLADRGLGDIAFETPNASDITVLSWNTLGDAPGATTIANLALEQGAEVITMPETTVTLGNAVKRIMDAAGTPMQVISAHFDLVSKARSTTMLVSTKLGEYAIDPAAGSTKQLPSIVAKPVDGNGPTLIAVHPIAPDPNNLRGWSSDLEWLASTCVGDNVIMAGDFNSTLDHYGRLPHAPGATLGDCADVGAASGNGGVGTWPTSVPAMLGTPIDHVMTTSNWKVTGMRVIESLDKAGSDHRPILVQLSPR